MKSSIGHFDFQWKKEWTSAQLMDSIVDAFVAMDTLMCLVVFPCIFVTVVHRSPCRGTDWGQFCWILLFRRTPNSFPTNFEGCRCARERFSNYSNESILINLLKGLKWSNWRDSIKVNFRFRLVFPRKRISIHRIRQTIFTTNSDMKSTSMHLSLSFGRICSTVVHRSRL